MEHDGTYTGMTPLDAKRTLLWRHPAAPALEWVNWKGPVNVFSLTYPWIGSVCMLYISKLLAESSAISESNFQQELYCLIWISSDILARGPHDAPHHNKCRIRGDCCWMYSPPARCWGLISEQTLGGGRCLWTNSDIIPLKERLNTPMEQNCFSCWIKMTELVCLPFSFHCCSLRTFLICSMLNHTYKGFVALLKCYDVEGNHKNRHEWQPCEDMFTCGCCSWRNKCGFLREKNIS